MLSVASEDEVCWSIYRWLNAPTVGEEFSSVCSAAYCPWFDFTLVLITQQHKTYNSTAVTIAIVTALTSKL